MLVFEWLVEREWSTPLSWIQFNSEEQFVLVDEIGERFVH